MSGNSPVLVIVIVLSNRESFMYCPNCGSDNPTDGKFCRHCGTGLEAVSAALRQKPGDASAPTSKLAELIKGYQAGQHKMMFGGGSIALGAVATVFLLMTGLWGFFWIFFWAFMGLFGGGADQFRRGWSRWSKASSELKALGYQKPPAGFTATSESASRSEEHTSELQSLAYLVCRLLLEKKKKQI